MMVRCGACRQEFDVAGDGRYPCPHCGAVNQVGEIPPPMPAQEPVSEPPPGGISEDAPSPLHSVGTPAPPPTPEVTPVRRVMCGECLFQFAVGDIATAICPNCDAKVAVPGGKDPAEVEAPPE